MMQDETGKQEEEERSSLADSRSPRAPGTSAERPLLFERRRAGKKCRGVLELRSKPTPRRVETTKKIERTRLTSCSELEHSLTS